jgi:hypothetical protein
MPVPAGQKKRVSLPSFLEENRFPFSRRAFWAGALLLVILEVLATLIRAHFLPNEPFFRLQSFSLGIAILKGLTFGPVLGVLTLRAYRFWRIKAWDDACYLCLRGGFILCGAQSLFVLLCFLLHSRFALYTWMVDSWPNFALWLPLNGSLVWALLLLVAGFLLPSDARKTIQVSESLRF